jgi:hypothetical protein
MKKIMNNGIFYVVISLLAVLSVGTLVYGYVSGQNVVNVNNGGTYNNYEAEGQALPSEESNFGAVSGPDVYSDVSIYGSLTYGNGEYYATTTSGESFTISAQTLRDYNYIDVMNIKENLAYTLPATSTMMEILPGIGSTRKWLFHNATSSARTLTLIKGAGMDLVAVTANDDVIDAGEWTQVTCTQIYYRAADDENIMCIVDELANAD